MVGSQDKRCALDVNILLDLAEGQEFASEFLKVAQEKYCPLYVTPTAFIELELLVRDGIPQRKKAATNAIATFHKWGVSVFDLKPVQHGYTKEFAQRLIRKGYLSEEEYNDGLILAEAGCFGIPVLVTSDHHLLDIPPSTVAAELKASDFWPTLVVRPQQIVRIASRYR
ncbi:MAG TPA: type II toxin-antitoxin system VapC family toxin [Candidatus Acidoferrum sp.]|nr:type II toxin-antitoxin system VapC family toxin [Candidatus Acidoferrum sp.]